VVTKRSCTDLGASSTTAAWWAATIILRAACARPGRRVGTERLLDRLSSSPPRHGKAVVGTVVG